jgi:hypothetical protein
LPARYLEHGVTSLRDPGAWIEAYVPDNPSALKPLPDGPDEHVMFAADVWYGLKKHWALEAQSFVRARRALPPG